VKRTIFGNKDSFVWVDLVGPTREELLEISREFGLSPQAAEDCLEPGHLPKIEPHPNAYFLVVRYADIQTHRAHDADTVQELTRKVACFFGEKFLVTIHRQDADFLSGILLKYGEGKVEASPLSAILREIFNGVLNTYEAPLDFAETRFDEYEASLFEHETHEPFEALYFLKRKASVYRRVLRQTTDVMLRIKTDIPTINVNGIKQRSDRMAVIAEELVDDVNSLLNVELSLSAKKTNDVVRVLTLFSVFFMPLTFIVGVYGMNFRYMPELDSKLGYPAVWLIMIITSAAIYLWFRRKGWLR